VVEAFSDASTGGVLGGGVFGSVSTEGNQKDPAGRGRMGTVAAGKGRATAFASNPGSTRGNDDYVSNNPLSALVAAPSVTSRKTGINNPTGPTLARKTSFAEGNTTSRQLDPSGIVPRRMDLSVIMDAPDSNNGSRMASRDNSKSSIGINPKAQSSLLSGLLSRSGSVVNFDGQDGNLKGKGKSPSSPSQKPFNRKNSSGSGLGNSPSFTAKAGMRGGPLAAKRLDTLKSNEFGTESASLNSRALKKGNEVLKVESASLRAAFDRFDAEHGLGDSAGLGRSKPLNSYKQDKPEEPGPTNFSQYKRASLIRAGGMPGSSSNLGPSRKTSIIAGGSTLSRKPSILKTGSRYESGRVLTHRGSTTTFSAQVEENDCGDEDEGYSGSSDSENDDSVILSELISPELYSEFVGGQPRVDEEDSKEEQPTEDDEPDPDFCEEDDEGLQKAKSHKKKKKRRSKERSLFGKSNGSKLIYQSEIFPLLELFGRYSELAGKESNESSHDPVSRKQSVAPEPEKEEPAPVAEPAGRKHRARGAIVAAVPLQIGETPGGALVPLQRKQNHESLIPTCGLSGIEKQNSVVQPPIGGWQYEYSKLSLQEIKTELLPHLKRRYLRTDGVSNLLVASGVLPTARKDGRIVSELIRAIKRSHMGPPQSNPNAGKVLTSVKSSGNLSGGNPGKVLHHRSSMTLVGGVVRGNSAPPPLQISGLSFSELIQLICLLRRMTSRSRDQHFVRMFHRFVTERSTFLSPLTGYSAQLGFTIGSPDALLFFSRYMGLNPRSRLEQESIISLLDDDDEDGSGSYTLLELRNSYEKIRTYTSRSHARTEIRFGEEVLGLTHDQTLGLTSAFFSVCGRKGSEGGHHGVSIRKDVESGANSPQNPATSGSQPTTPKAGNRGSGYSIAEMAVKSLPQLAKSALTNSYIKTPIDSPLTRAGRGIAVDSVGKNLPSPSRLRYQKYTVEAETGAPDSSYLWKVFGRKSKKNDRLFRSGKSIAEGSSSSGSDEEENTQQHHSILDDHGVMGEFYGRSGYQGPLVLSEKHCKGGIKLDRLIGNAGQGGSGTSTSIPGVEPSISGGNKGLVFGPLGNRSRSGTGLAGRSCGGGFGGEYYLSGGISSNSGGNSTSGGNGRSLQLISSTTLGNPTTAQSGAAGQGGGGNGSKVGEGSLGANRATGGGGGQPLLRGRFEVLHALGRYDSFFYEDESTSSMVQDLISAGTLGHLNIYQFLQISRKVLESSESSLNSSKKTEERNLNNVLGHLRG